MQVDLGRDHEKTHFSSGPFEDRSVEDCSSSSF